MSGTTEIRQALISPLTAASGCNIPSASIAWENKSYTPGAARWYRETFLPAGQDPAAIGTAAENRHEGIFEVDVFEPPNTGDAKARTEAERVASFYKRGTTLTHSGVVVYCEKAEVRSGDASDPAWYRTPVLVYWRSDVAN